MDTAKLFFSSLIHRSNAAFTTLLSSTPLLDAGSETSPRLILYDLES